MYHFKSTIINSLPIFFISSTDHKKLAGTKKQTRLHAIGCPEELDKCSPQPNTTTYLYMIHVQPCFDTNQNDPNVQVFHRLLSSRRHTFAIATSTDTLPKVADIRCFFTFGRVMTSIATEKSIQCQLTEKNLNDLRNFHTMLFRQMLSIQYPFVCNDLNNGENSYLIVPICDVCQIDWPLVLALPMLTEPSVTAEQHQNQLAPAEPINFNDYYLNKVVAPIYRLDRKQVYIVTAVHTDKSPATPFPNGLYRNYAEYFAIRYNCMVSNMQQPLIEVKGVTLNLNRLTPGANRDGSRKFQTRQELLVPELCHNFCVPGEVWLKATLLPSTLHRFKFLLHAERIRLLINRSLGINSTLTHSAIEDDDIEEDEEKVKQLIQDPDSKTTTIDDSSNILNPWETDDPIDHHRSISDIYPLEMDYYQHFVDNEQHRVAASFARLQLNSDLEGAANAFPLPSQIRPISMLKLNRSVPVHGPRQCDLLAALTSTTAMDTFNLERFEVIGDAFLKFASSLFLLHAHPDWHEGFLTATKGQMVSNRNLCYVAFKAKLPSCLNVQQFRPQETWLPPSQCVPAALRRCISDLDVSPQHLHQVELSATEMRQGRPELETCDKFLEKLVHVQAAGNDHKSPMYAFMGMHRLVDKTVADSIEAILGTCVTTVGIDRCFNVLRLLRIFPDPRTDYSLLLKAKLTQPRLRSNVSAERYDELLINYQRIETRLGYRFRDRAYLLQALTHPSFPTNNLTGCYQQLEFIGDAILDQLVSAYIFEQCPRKSPGKLTDIRSALVNNVTLACLCVRNHFHLHILHQNALLGEKIELFAQFQKNNGHKIDDHVLLLRPAKGDRMGEYVDVPKTLGDIMESIIGAVFLDSGNDLTETWSVVYRLMHVEMAAFILRPPMQVVRELFEWKDARPRFEEPYVEDDVTMVTVRFTCRNELRQVQGFGENKESAKRAAAMTALTILRGDDDSDNK